MEGVYAGGSEFFQPGCWACGACIDACPEDAIAFTLDPKTLPQEAAEKPTTKDE